MIMLPADIPTGSDRLVSQQSYIARNISHKNGLKIYTAMIPFPRFETTVQSRVIACCDGIRGMVARTSPPATSDNNELSPRLAKRIGMARRLLHCREFEVHVSGE